MSGVGQTIDQTANLPDELLCQVFGYLPLRVKLRLESVSHRFQRIILELLKRPQPLDFTIAPDRRLNGYKIRWEQQLPEALWSLASKSKFSEVRISIPEKRRDAERTEQLDSLLSILLVTNCLDKVMSFKCNYGSSEDIFEKIFAQCVKLSSVTLDFIVHSPNTQCRGIISVMDLCSVLNTKALTHLDLRLGGGYPQGQLRALFHSIKPHTLEKLSLTFTQTQPLNLAEMVKQLSTNAWAALQEIKISWEETTAHIDLEKFFGALTLIPSLKKCHILFDWVNDVQPDNQFITAMTSLFKSDIKITITSPWYQAILRHNVMPDCQVVAQIRELQIIHPNMGVDFAWDHGFTPILTLSMGNGRFEELIPFPKSCAVADCVECHRFYPRLLYNLEDKADEYTDTHLEGYQLDRCRIDTLVDRLNDMNEPWRTWRALSAEVNDEGDLVTINFEDEDDQTEIDQYSITVRCGRCFN